MIHVCDDFFKNPYAIKIKTSQVLIEGEDAPKHDAVYYRWMSLSKDSDIIVNKDWIVCITDPLDSITKSYEERMNGRRSNDPDRPSSGSGSGGGSGSGATSDPDIVLNEPVDPGLTD